ncbi:hypothetical protein Tco_0779723, partial [Tanacetum coccineum]
MAQLKYCDKHNQVGFLLKPAESAGYTEIVDFLRRSKLRYALTHNPPIYDSLVKQFWQTATARTLADGTQQLNATIDSIEYTITEESVRRQLQLADASGINMLQNEEIFAGLQNIGSKSGGWDQFGSNIATALICLSTGRDFNFSKLIFDGMISNLKSKSKFLMYPQGIEVGKGYEKERRNLVLTDSEEEEPEAQGRKSDDPQDSSVQGLITPPTTKVNTSGEEQVEEISPNTLEAAKTLSKVASLKPRSIDKGRRYKRRKETKGKKVVSSLDFQEDDAVAEKINTAGEINAASIEVNTASKVNTGSIELNTVIEQDSTAGENKGQREGKAPMLSEETPKKSKEQILQEKASLAEAIRLDSLQKEEEAEQIHLDALLAQRLAEEEELTEQQKKRKAQVQFEAQHYTNEDWDLIRAKLEANAELSKSMLGSGLQGEDFAKRMVDLVNQRKKFFAEERAKAKRNKPMTQSQLKTYMMNYLKNQGSWKLNQLRKLSFDEVKKEFDKLVKQVESFATIIFEATKDSLKRIGEELQTKTPKRLKEDKDDEAKDDEPTKKSGKRRKQIARKGMHTSVDKNDSEDSDKVGEQEETGTG